MAIDDRIKVMIAEDVKILHEEIHSLAARVLDLERQITEAKRQRPARSSS